MADAVESVLSCGVRANPLLEEAVVERIEAEFICALKVYHCYAQA